MAVAEQDDEISPAPTVIVDGLCVVYRVPGASTGEGSATSALSRLVAHRKSLPLDQICAIRSVSLTAYRGEAVGLIGRNGAGKSTLLAAIAGLLPAERGAVYTDGQPSLLGVSSAMVNDLSGERNVILGCLAMGMSRATAYAKYADIVEFSGIGDAISRPMRTYSSGMKARLRFSIATAMTHDVLLIDEALTTGDSEFQRRSEQRIHELTDNARTVFLISHSLRTIQRTCNRAIWLDNGKIHLDGDVDEVVAAYRTATS